MKLSNFRVISVLPTSVVESQSSFIVTAEASDVLLGKIFVDSDKNSITGTMPNNGAISGTIDGLITTSFVIPAGYTTGGTISLTSDIEDALSKI